MWEMWGKGKGMTKEERRGRGRGQGSGVTLSLTCLSSCLAASPILCTLSISKCLPLALKFSPLHGSLLPTLSGPSCLFPGPCL
jgi:hypothetical protein